ncbi:hypothetical protein L202_00700 [Cryptococcus amylolentus CBS 6039]|uniref:Uncharacterized protein n=1 Tax=Cryptococcus amylolentus CBS 6039 TaxID=1295533 RepID=A0A1E3I865_9TREE|nr:hypothetical protein L202_00700 [Cryptococcus amylolentus CBS 6039]ODN84839.1 hypothetical protein L202_00700 [Cryptococcus amylolentus CBS 6039]
MILQLLVSSLYTFITKIQCQTANLNQTKIALGPKMLQFADPVLEIVDLTAAPEIEYQGSQPGEAASKPSTTVPQSLPENDSVKGDLQSIVDDEGERN